MINLGKLVITLSMAFHIQAFSAPLGYEECDNQCNYSRAGHALSRHYFKKWGRILEKRAVKFVKRHGINERHAANTVIGIKALVEQKIETKTKIYKYYYIYGKYEYRDQEIKLMFKYDY